MQWHLTAVLYVVAVVVVIIWNNLPTDDSDCQLILFHSVLCDYLRQGGGYVFSFGRFLLVCCLLPSNFCVVS